jgi:uncharacterized membrane protein
MAIYCSECGSKNVDTAKFCQKCGSPIAKVDEAPPSVSQAPINVERPAPQPVAPPPPQQPVRIPEPPVFSPPPPPQTPPPPVVPPPVSQPGAMPPPVYVPPPPVQQQPPIYTGTTPAPGAASSDTLGLSSNLGGLLAYVGWWISGVILFVLEKKDGFIRFHAAQSIVAFGAITILNIIISILTAIPVFPVFLFFSIVSGLLWAASVVLWIFMMYKAYKGQLTKLPFAGDLAKKIFKV